MRFNEGVLDGTEKLIYSLRDLYVSAGYERYKMSKFEEYALYGRNIDFLVSDRVITFTDTDGKLMALKPDVTLSIVKNDRDGGEGVRRICYNENVYRVSRGTGTFREIMQSGLECIGEVDCGVIGEVLLLAAKSLEKTGAKFVLEVSHLGIIESAIGDAARDDEERAALMKCAGDKNVHGIREICGERGALLEGLVALHGSANKVLADLAALPLGDGGWACAAELERVLSCFAGTGYEDFVTVDFSVTADASYYNGMIFKGFVEGVPESVLSGGQYDRLMKKMGRRSSAVGFAVYLDVLERLLYGEEAAK